MPYGYGTGYPRSRGPRVATAPDYEAPVGDDPVAVPSGSPNPPGDTPTDPGTGEPEPGVDPNWTEPTRIELTDSKQTVIRTSADPGTWGNAYIGTPLTGYDYWEIHIANSTPKNATIAAGVTNTGLSLNDVPGVDAGTFAWWSDGSTWTNSVETTGLPTFKRGDKMMFARDNDTGRIWIGKNGSWVGSTPSVGGSGHQGTLTGSGPYYAFIGLYSEGSTATFKFISSKFAYAAPSGFYGIGLTPDATPDAFVFTDVTDATTSTVYTSNTIAVAGLSTGTSVAVTITGGTYSKNGGGYTSDAGTAVNGDTFAVRGTSSASQSTAVNVVLTIGGVSDTYTVTTAGDPHWASVVLLAGFDGTDGSTTFTDDSGSAHTLTAAGAAAIDTDQSKFGGASLFNPGASTDRVTIPADTDWDIGSVDFTVEMWLRVNSLSNCGLVGRPTTSGTAAYRWIFFLSSGGGLFLYRGSGALVSAAGAGITAGGSFKHVALTKDGTTYRLFLDGVKIAENTTATTISDDPTFGLVIGDDTSSAGRELNGWIDELRITKGVARYTADFTPATEAFPRG